MGILSWIVMGLIVGVLAKFIMPGKDPGGIYSPDRYSRGLCGRFYRLFFRTGGGYRL